MTVVLTMICQLPIKVVRATVGDMSATDADMAVVANAIVITFNTKLQQPIAKLLSSERISS